jgi:hypothetical protein
MSFSSTGQSVGVSGQGFSSVVKKKKKNEVKRDGDMSSLPLLMPFGDAKVEDGTSVSKKESVKKVKKKVKKVSAEPTKKKEESSSQVLTGMLQRTLGTDQRTKTTTPDASVLTSLLHKAMTPKPPPKSILPVSFFDQSDVISTKPASNSTQAKVSAVPIHSSLQKFLNISSPSSKIVKTTPKEDVDIKKKQIEEKKKKQKQIEEKKKKQIEEKKKKQIEEEKKKKAEEKKKKQIEEERRRRKKKKANEDKKKKTKKKDAPKRVVKKILSRKEKKKERSEDEAVVLTADGVEISLDPMAFWNEMEAEADNEYEAERRARRLQRQAEREKRKKKKNKTSS